MLTQTRLNYIQQRVIILLGVKGSEYSTSILVDVNEFFNKLKSIKKITEIKGPDEVECHELKEIEMTWYKSYEANNTFDCLTITFDGSGKIKYKADYESLDIKVEQTLGLNDDFPHLVMTHINQFKRPIVKKRYK